MLGHEHDFTMHWFKTLPWNPNWSKLKFIFNSHTTLYKAHNLRLCNTKMYRNTFFSQALQHTHLVFSTALQQTMDQFLCTELHSVLLRSVTDAAQRKHERLRSAAFCCVLLRSAAFCDRCRPKEAWGAAFCCVLLRSSASSYRWHHIEGIISMASDR